MANGEEDDMFVRTDRLLLRPGWPEDAPALAAAIGEERIVRNLAQVPWPYGMEDAKSYLASGFDGPLPSFVILVRTSGAPTFAGAIGLARVANGDVELGYWIGSAFWNRGYVTEAGHAVLALARESLDLHRIVSGHFADNPASGRVLEKLGFEATGEGGARYSVARGEDAAFRSYAIERICTMCGETELIGA